MSDTPVVPLPPSYDWGFVVGRSISAMADTAADWDRHPEARGSNGRVTFTPHTRFKKELSAPTAFVQFEVVTARIVNGNVVDAQGEDGLYLISGAYKVAFTIESGSIPGFDILVTPEHTLENPLDLVTAAPFVPEVGTPVTTAIIPAGAAEDQVLAWRNGRLVWVNGSVQAEAAAARAEAAATAAEEWAPSFAWDGTKLVINGETGPDLKGELGGVSRAYVDARTAPLQSGKNLWNPGEVVSGYTLGNSGELAASAAYDASGFVRVDAGQAYTLWGMSGSADGGPLRGPRAWAFYDSQQGYVSSDNDSSMPVLTVTAPQNGYLRASFRREVVASPMIEAGSAPTEYEPYRTVISGLTLEDVDFPDGVITPANTTFARTGKNLLDPSEFAPDEFLNGGVTAPLAGYTTSGYFPVEAGKQYVGAIRAGAWFTADGGYMGGFNTGSNTNVTVQTAPVGAGLMRVSWYGSAVAPKQYEQGTTPTEFEPFGIAIPNLINAGGGSTPTPASGPVQVTATESGSAQIRSLVGSQPLDIHVDLSESRNGTFNFVSAMLGGTVVTMGNDEITPLRTFNTVGANHGYTCISDLTVTGHGKTAADLGSVWTDGEKQWTLLLIDGDTLTLGPQYTRYESGVATASSSPPVAALTHVSGATNTASIPVDSVVTGAQLYPSVQRVHTTLLVDGQPVSDGEHHGTTAQIRESYEVLDYASIIDTAQANIGVPFHQRVAKGAVRVENVYTFKPGLTLVDVALTELTPTILGSCGFVQAMRPAGTGGRIVPGVTGWITPKSFSDTWERKVVTIADLIDPTIPPVMSLDVMDWGGFALGYFPHSGGVTASAERIENGGSRLWDLRDTMKSYPSPWASKSAGWGRVEAHAYRAYLTPEQAAEVAAVAEDAHAAHSALASVTGL